MTSTATAVETFGLWISPTDSFRLLHWHSVSTPQQALMCHTAQPVKVTGGLTMWTDSDAIPLRRPRNARAAELLHAWQPHPGIYFGDVVFTGATGIHSDPVEGLTEDQALELLDLYLLRRTTHVPSPRRH